MRSHIRACLCLRIFGPAGVFLSICVFPPFSYFHNVLCMRVFSARVFVCIEYRRTGSRSKLRAGKRQSHTLPCVQTKFSFLPKTGVSRTPTLLNTRTGSQLEIAGLCPWVIAPPWVEIKGFSDRRAALPEAGRRRETPRGLWKSHFKVQTAESSTGPSAHPHAAAN